MPIRSAETFKITGPDYETLINFQAKHLSCTEYLKGCVGATPSDCFTYTFIPSSFGGLVNIKCVCGAKLCLSYGESEPYEIAATASKGITPDEVTIALLDELFTLLDRPGLYLGKAPSADSFDAYETGIGVAISIAGVYTTYLGMRTIRWTRTAQRERST